MHFARYLRLLTKYPYRSAVTGIGLISSAPIAKMIVPVINDNDKKDLDIGTITCNDNHNEKKQQAEKGFVVKRSESIWDHNWDLYVLIHSK
jgi:hypothetical protein